MELEYMTETTQKPILSRAAAGSGLVEPVHIISLGAGVQSSTMALMAALGEITPMPSAAIFADTQAEPASVYEWLDWLETQLPFPVYRVTAGNIEERELKLIKSKKSGRIYRKSGIPAFVKGMGILSRKCTTDFKLKPIFKKAKELGSVKRGQKYVSVIQWIGISSDEVIRMKPSREPWAKNIWPLVDMNMSRSKCLAWMQKRGYPVPPRSACYFCPFHSDTEWRRLRDDEPHEFQRAIEFEQKMQAANAQDETAKGVPYLHDSTVPLADVDFRTDLEMGQGHLWGNECEGMCGV
jgi:hypothetical protein